MSDFSKSNKWLLFMQCSKRRKRRNLRCQPIRIITTAFFWIITGQTTKKVEKCRTEEFCWFDYSIGEKSYTVVHHKCMKENVVWNEILIPNKAKMLFQMERHWTCFRTRCRWWAGEGFLLFLASYLTLLPLMTATQKPLLSHETCSLLWNLGIG